MKKTHSHEQVGARVRAVRDSLFGPLSPGRWERLSTTATALLRRGAEWEQARKATHEMLIGLAFHDHTLAPMVLGRIAQEKPHRLVLWKSLEMVNMVLMNPTMFHETHDRMHLDVEGTMDNAYAMVIRCVEWAQMPAGSGTEPAGTKA